MDMKLFFADGEKMNKKPWYHLILMMLLIISFAACGTEETDYSYRTIIYKKSLQGIKPAKQVAFETLIYKYANMFSDAQTVDGGETKLGAQLRIREEREKALKQFFLEDNTFFGWVGEVVATDINEQGYPLGTEHIGAKGTYLGGEVQNLIDGHKADQTTLRIKLTTTEESSKGKPDIYIQSFLSWNTRSNIPGTHDYTSSGYLNKKNELRKLYANMGIPEDKEIRKGERVVINGGFGTNELVKPFQDRNIPSALGDKNSYYYLGWNQSQKDFLVEMSSYPPCNTGKIWKGKGQYEYKDPTGQLSPTSYTRTRCMGDDALSDSVMLNPIFLVEIGGYFRYEFKDNAPLNYSHFQTTYPTEHPDYRLTFPTESYPLDCDPKSFEYPRVGVNSTENAADRVGMQKALSICTGFPSIERVQTVSTQNEDTSTTVVNTGYKIPNKDDGVRDYYTGSVCECTLLGDSALCGDKPSGTEHALNTEDLLALEDDFNEGDCLSWEERVAAKREIDELEDFCEGKPEDTPVPVGISEDAIC
jgi:hypothetical protein